MAARAKARRWQSPMFRNPKPALMELSCYWKGGVGRQGRINWGALHLHCNEKVKKLKLPQIGTAALNNCNRNNPVSAAVHVMVLE